MHTPIEELRLALVQTNLHWQDPAKNRAHFEEILEDVAGRADLIVLPEMFTTGFSMDTSCAEVFNTDTCRWIKMAAGRLDACILGSVMTMDRGTFYNRLIVARPGEPLVWYDKRHLFRMAGEHDHYTPGDRRLVFTHRGWRICPLVCYDLRFPVFARNTPVAYDLLLYTANWPDRRRQAWNALLPARAVENLCYCGGVNIVGDDGNGHQYVGDSQVVAYDGAKMLEMGGANETGLVTLSHKSLMAFRDLFPAWQDADAFELR